MSSKCFSVVLSVAFAAPAMAQCGADWLPEVVPLEVDGAVFGSCEWDPDGAGPAGPALVLVGAFTAASTVPAAGIVMFDPASSLVLPLCTSIDGVVRSVDVLTSGELVVAGEFTSIDGVVVNRVARFDGLGWSPCGSGVDGSVHEVIAEAGGLLAVGDFSNAGGASASFVAQWSQASGWSGFGGGPANAGRSVTRRSSGRLVVGTTFGISEWDGVSWSAPEGPEGPVFTMLDLPNGVLLAGGDFSMAQGVTANNVAASSAPGVWGQVFCGLTSQSSVDSVNCLRRLADGTLFAGGAFDSSCDGVSGPALSGSNVAFGDADWYAFGDHADLPVHTATQMGDGTLFFAGEFTSFAGTPVGRVGSYVGSAFVLPALLGAGADGDISDLLVCSDGRIVVAGDFTSFAGQTANRVAVFAPSTGWSAMGSGPSFSVNAVLEMPNGDILAGGAGSLGGSSTARLARWDGASWTLIPITGAIVGDEVFDLAIDGTGAVLVAGDFALGAHVKRWNGQNFFGMPGLNAHVNCVHVRPNGDIYVGGAFTSAPAVTLNRMARWNGSAWEALGSGVSGAVHAIAEGANGDLIVGGSFPHAGSQQWVNGIARWDGQTWSSVGSSPFNNNVRALERLPDGDIVAGLSSSSSVVWRWDGASWTSYGRTAGACRALQFDQRRGQLLTGGSLSQVGGYPVSRFARHASNCPPATTVVGAGCLGSGGLNELEVTVWPYVGGRYAARATGLPSSAFCVSAYGFTGLTLPLNLVLPLAAPACSLHNSADVIEIAWPVAGSLSPEFAIPPSAALAGVELHHQVVTVELSPTLVFLDATSTNGISFEIGFY